MTLFKLLNYYYYYCYYYPYFTAQSWKFFEWGVEIHTFCKNTMSEAISNPMSYFHISFGRVPSAPMTTGTILTFLHSQSLCSSLFKSWYFSIFSLILQPSLVSKGHARHINDQTFSSILVQYYNIWLLASTR